MVGHNARVAAAHANPLTIVGLGPGDASLLTIEARDVLASAGEVWLRTARHPTVAGLPPGPGYHSFDEIYESGASFDQVYERIVARVLELAARPEGVVYAVPGHPLFGEATTRALLERAATSGISASVVPGISFLDAAAAALALDPLADGLLLIDALALAPHRRLLAPQRPTIIAQVYDRRAASQVKLSLLEAYPPDHPVKIVRAAGTADARVVDTRIAELDRSDGFDHLTLVYLPALPMLEDVRTFEGVRAVVARLRAPEGGCPWDLEQTHETLRRYLLEEAYEALDALDQGEPKRLAEEMGDLLMQIVLHAQIAEDNGEFAIEDVFASIATKLIRRHPHVFGDMQVEGADEVLRNWETLKKQERGDEPLLDHVPKAMPALMQAQSVQSRATKAGYAPEGITPDAAVAALRELVDGPATPESLGKLLMAIVAMARSRDIDAEDALRLAITRYRAHVADEEAKRGDGG
jgi:tetrapyrrole methylase family protein/MazG family protein